MKAWFDYGFTVGMPHMVPNKLSEVELLKWLGAYQWDSISELLGRRSHQITNLEKERLYASFITVELFFPSRCTIDSFEEGASVSVRNRIGVYGRRFVEGMLLFDHREIPSSATESVLTKDDLARSELPWAYVTNAFIARSGSNTKLKVFEPEGMDAAQIAHLKSPPVGIAEHQQVQSTGKIGSGELPGGALPLARREHAPDIVYKISPESDLNGAALLYFARYVAMMDYGVRRFLSEQLERPVSNALVECLSTEHRRIFYFVNADPSDSVRIFVDGHYLPATGGARIASSPGRSSVGKFFFKLDLHRASDGALMATTLVTKSLNIPDRDKSLHSEATRLFARLGAA